MLHSLSVRNLEHLFYWPCAFSSGDLQNIIRALIPSISVCSWLSLTVERMLQKISEWNQIRIDHTIAMEACAAERLAHFKLLIWRSGSLTRRVSLDKELYSTLSLFTQVYKWVLVTYCWGVTMRWTSIPFRGGWIAILLSMLHAKETRISSTA